MQETFLSRPDSQSLARKLAERSLANEMIASAGERLRHMPADPVIRSMRNATARGAEHIIGRWGSFTGATGGLGRC